jgi:large subunit ribosomal protein L15
MAELHDLSPSSGSHRGRKRLGRGPGSGQGKTAGRGQKGQKARTGGKVHPRFEGGQMPLIRRIPKRGFTNLNRVEYQVVNVRDLERFDGDVTPAALKDAGLIRSVAKPVKVLGEGELTKKLAVSAHAFSGTARTKIEGAGGSASVLATESSEE